MKKILYLHAGAELYGADIVLLELLKNLDKNKFKPYVVLPCDGPLVDKFRENNIWVEVLEYPILRRKYFNPVGIFNYVKDYFIYSNKISKIVEKEGINLLHINTAAVLEGVYIKRKSKIPLVWHIHEIIVKPRFMHKILSFLISKNADEVVTVSESVKKHLEDTNYFRNNINVIYNGINNDIFNTMNDYNYIKKEFNIQTSAKVVGMIGRVNSWKGQNDFIDAMDLVLSKHKDVYAVLVGGVFEGEEWRILELKNKINLMKNSERIIFSDYRRDTPNIHSMYDIFVLPSINPDPLPTVVLEAMGSGTPIVAYRHGGVCEMVKHNYNGLLANVRDIDELANSIDKLLSDNELRSLMGENSLVRQKEMFSMKSYIGNFEILYNKL